MAKDPQYTVVGSLQDMIDWSERAQYHYARWKSEPEADDDLFTLALERCFGVIGEAASRAMKADPGLVARMPQLDLLNAYRMRNRIVHAYDGVDSRVIKLTIEEDLPQLCERLREAVRDLS